MKVTKNRRGFDIIERDNYAEEGKSRLVQESSAVGDYDDSFDNPGSSFLWVGDHHLNREEVTDLISFLQQWADTGHLSGENKLS